MNNILLRGLRVAGRLRVGAGGRLLRAPHDAVGRRGVHVEPAPPGRRVPAFCASTRQKNDGVRPVEPEARHLVREELHDHGARLTDARPRRACHDDVQLDYAGSRVASRSRAEVEEGRPQIRARGTVSRTEAQGRCQKGPLASSRLDAYPTVLLFSTGEDPDDVGARDAERREADRSTPLKCDRGVAATTATSR